MHWCSQQVVFSRSCVLGKDIFFPMGQNQTKVMVFGAIQQIKLKNGQPGWCLNLKMNKVSKDLPSIISLTTL